MGGMENPAAAQQGAGKGRSATEAGKSANKTPPALRHPPMPWPVADSGIIHTLPTPSTPGPHTCEYFDVHKGSASHRVPVQHTVPAAGRLGTRGAQRYRRKEAAAHPRVRHPPDRHGHLGLCSSCGRQARSGCLAHAWEQHSSQPPAHRRPLLSKAFLFSALNSILQVTGSDQQGRNLPPPAARGRPPACGTPYAAAAPRHPRRPSRQSRR